MFFQVLKSVAEIHAGVLSDGDDSDSKHPRVKGKKKRKAKKEVRRNRPARHGLV